MTSTLKFTTTELLQVVNVMSFGQQSDGEMVSATMTSCVQVVEFPQLSTARQMPRYTVEHGGLNSNGLDAMRLTVGFVPQLS